MESCNVTADQRSYQCEDCEEYLLIQEATPVKSAEQEEPHLLLDEEGLKQRGDKGKMLKVGGSADSGYEGKVSPPSSSPPVTPQNNVAPQEVLAGILVHDQDHLLLFSFSRMAKRSGVLLSKN